MAVTMPFADAGDDRFLGGSADQAFDVGAHGDAGFDFQLDAVLGHAVDAVAAHGGAGDVDHFRIHAGLHGIENVAAGQIDGGRGLPGQIDVGLVGGDHGVDDALHVAAGQHVRFHFRVVTLIPARLAWMRALTIASALTFRSRMPIRSTSPTFAPLTRGPNVQADGRATNTTSPRITCLNGIFSNPIQYPYSVIWGCLGFADFSS
jgi:hypothetical protein